MDRLIANYSVPLAQADTAPTTGTPQYATDGDPATNKPATLFPAYAFNAIQDEIRNVIVAAGLTPDSTKWDQLQTAIQTMLQGSTTNVGIDTGVANAYVVAFAPALGAPMPWAPFWIKVKTANTGPSTLNATGTVEPWVGAGHQALQGGELVANGNALTYWNPTLAAGAGSYVLLFCSGAAEQIAPATASQHAVQLGQIGHGQCRLSVTNATMLTLKPFNGNNVIVNGVPLQLPSAGLTVSNAGLSASTLYYVYLSGTTAAPSLTVSATGHSTASNGVEVQTGNAAVTLIGAIYTNASSQFIDSTTSISLINWFNRVLKYGATPTINASTTYGGGLIELSTSCQIPFLTWADEAVRMTIIGTTQNTTAGGINTTSTGIDGTASGAASNMQSYAGGATVPSISITNIYLSEGHHIASAFGEVSTGQGNWSIGTQVVVMG